MRYISIGWKKYLTVRLENEDDFEVFGAISIMFIKIPVWLWRTDPTTTLGGSLQNHLILAIPPVI